MTKHQNCNPSNNLKNSYHDNFILSNEIELLERKQMHQNFHNHNNSKTHCKKLTHKKQILLGLLAHDLSPSYDP